jgi:hypothetical protein
MTQSKEISGQFKKTKGQPHLNYVDTEDAAWQRRMQDPETWDDIQRLLLNKELKDWPDQILLAELPQVPDAEIDAPIVEIIGRTAGPVRHIGDVTIEKTDKDITFFRPNSTKFVRVIRGDGVELMERWSFTKHGEWEKIPDTGVTPAELIEQLYGFGYTEVNEGQQFQNTRKKRASKTNWKTDNHPQPVTRKRSPRA